MNSNLESTITLPMEQCNLTAFKPDTSISPVDLTADGLGDLEAESLHFTQDFVFVADPSDVIEVENFYPGAFDNWDISFETHVGGKILDQSRTTISGVDFTAETLVGETDSTYEVLKDYQLYLRQEAYESFEIYIGTARFSMRVESDGLWYIHRWEDARRDTGIVADKDTWGKLKGEIRATT